MKILCEFLLQNWCKIIPGNANVDDSIHVDGYELIA